MDQVDEKEVPTIEEVWRQTAFLMSPGLPIGIFIYWVFTLFFENLKAPSLAQAVLLTISGMAAATYASNQVRMLRTRSHMTFSDVISGIASLGGIAATVFYPEIRAFFGLVN
ncbi:MAG: hypothetical protein AAF608_04645 [Pseudomonadota bacterium]